MKPLRSLSKKILILQGKLFLVLRDKWNVKYLSGLGFYFAKDNKVENTHLFCVIWENENCKLNRIFIIKNRQNLTGGGINFHQ